MSNTKVALSGKRLGIASLVMIPISMVGTFAFSLIFISAPVGIACGIIAAKRGNKNLGIAGAVINAVLILGLITLWIIYASSKND